MILLERPTKPARVAMASLIDRLPEVRGRYDADADLSSMTWFRVGGKADVVFRPADDEDLAEFLAGVPSDVPVMVIGVGSNLLVRDGGIRGVVVRLGKSFAQVRVEDGEIVAGAGMLDANVAATALRAGRTGLEFLSGIPGTIGGGLRMNAGAYGGEFKDVLVEATAIDPLGHRHRMTPEEMGLSYRHSTVSSGWIFTSARLKAVPGDPGQIKQAMDDIRRARGDSQPLRDRTGGSTFANPPGGKAWKLIDEAGCRGLRVGGAMVSEKHCNFLINTGEATATDLEVLGETVRRRVLETSGVTLRWEIRRLGTLPEGVTIPKIEGEGR